MEENETVLDDRNNVLSVVQLFTDYKENNQPHSLKSIMIDKPSRYVLEMNGGSKKRFNLKEGDKINFIEKSKMKFKYF